MTALGQVLGTIVWLYFLLFLLRIVFDLVQAFARTWRPQGVLVVIVEFIYTVTDPPLRALRRIVPPLRIGQIQLDLAFLIVLIILQILMRLATSL
jgi:YggT family protein